MTKRSMKIVAISVVGLIVTLMISTFVITTVNEEIRLRNVITAKQRDNESEYDSLWKKISQAAAVTEAQKKALIEIFDTHASARGGGGGGTVVGWLHESVPDVDTTTFNNLQNIIAASRDRFAMRQKELLELKSAHDTVLDSFPSGPLLTAFGREKIDVAIITSTRAKSVFEERLDDELSIQTGGE